MGMKGRVGLAIALVLAMGAAQAQDNAGARAGRELGNLLFPRRDNSVYYNTLMRGLELRNQMYEAQQAKAQADALEQLARLRQLLAADWVKFGMTPDQADAVARAFAPSDSDDAVFLSVRGEPAPRVGSEIRHALGARNYQLANQLLLGFLIASSHAQ